jgi:hypothetical protein
VQDEFSEAWFSGVSIAAHVTVGTRGSPPPLYPSVDAPHPAPQYHRRQPNEKRIDEYRLMVFPVVVGSGKRLFRDGIYQTALKLVDAKTFGSGVLILAYHPAR